MDVPSLYNLCDDIPEEGANWDGIRSWLAAQSRSDAQVEIEQIPDSSLNCLHLICRKKPPVDIVRHFIELAPQSVRKADPGHGWLPLHVACAKGASEDVLKVLVSSFPQSTTTADKRGRTPLHFAIITQKDSLNGSTATLLGDSGATKMRDETDKLPLHYACAFGTSPAALRVLTDKYPEAIHKTDDQGFAPFHLALANSKPDAVRHLISLDHGVVNESVANNTRQLPIQLLGRRAASIRPEQEVMRESAERCVEIYLGAEPNATADFVTVLQSLPPWLRDVAVVTPYVKQILNKKISQVFHTGFLFLDVLFLVLNIISFSLASTEIIDSFCYGEVENSNNASKGYVFWSTRYYDPNNAPSGCKPNESFSYETCCTSDHFNVTSVWVNLLLSCATYFLLREIIQCASLAQLGIMGTWFNDLKNLVDLVCIGLSFYWGGAAMQKGTVADDVAYRYLVSITLFIYWIWVLIFLKSTLIGFAVFIEGVVFVVRRLLTFLMALAVILISFAMMFVTVFQQTSKCKPCTEDEINDNPQCYVPPNQRVPGEEFFPYCNFQDALLVVYTMLIGEVDDTDFYGSKVAMVLFTLFMFLVVILLANVLIAIVTDSYGVVKNERSAIIFWSNRLDFVAEIDVIAEGVWKKKLKCAQKTNNRLAEMWQDMIRKSEDDNMFSRIIAFLFIALVWLPLGFLTAGALWPPQVREYLLRRSYAELKKADHQNMEVEALEKEVRCLQQDINSMMSEERDGAVEMTLQVNQMKKAVMSEIDEIKEIMSELFELQSREQG